MGGFIIENASRSPPALKDWCMDFLHRSLRSLAPSVASVDACSFSVWFCVHALVCLVCMLVCMHACVCVCLHVRCTRARVLVPSQVLCVCCVCVCLHVFCCFAFVFPLLLLHFCFCCFLLLFFERFASTRRSKSAKVRYCRQFLGGPAECGRRPDVGQASARRRPGVAGALVKRPILKKTS